MDKQTEQDIDSTEITKRIVSKELEDILYKPIKVLDHGFIRVIDYMGTDSSIVQAARVSYGKGTKKTNQDKGLINYLMRHRHTTPFEMCEIKLHVKLPIFIARQWVRHRSASINEYSARYSVMGSDFYLPRETDLAPQSKVNKQGRESASIPTKDAERVLAILREDAERCYSHYVTLMNEDEHGNVIDPSCTGITRELARMNLTLNHYTEWYWKIDLHNLLHFLSLRADSHAQFEIREYAYKILEIVQKWVPYTYEAFLEYRKEGALFSRTGLSIIKKMIKGEKVTSESSGLSAREWQELMSVLRP
ncbi:MAG: FAD-dependent thymidylate synthase [Rickettsiaceae bacterium]|nr:FAD-dependent thymidylate synthase [Rickettsiaceae bacterium]